MTMGFSADEMTCVSKLAECYERNEISITKDDLPQFLGLAPDRVVPVLTMMEELGIISQVINAVGSRFISFKITSKAVQTAREIQKVTPMDIMEQVRLTLRQKPATAWPILFFLAIGAVVTVLNQLIGLLEKLGVFK